MSSSHRSFRTAIYLLQGTSVSLPFIAAIADQHPEAIEATPPTLDAPYHALKERCGPRHQATPKSERAPRMTVKFIRRTLGKDPKQAAAMQDRIKYERTMRRVMRTGV